MKYDYLIVGSGLTGSSFARKLKDLGKSVIVVEKRNHVGGNVYTEKIEGINVHKYGAHIFHTNNKKVWDFVNKYVEFNDYRHTVLANYKGEIYNLPFNMNTFKKMWGVNTEKEAKEIITKQSIGISDNPSSLEEQCIYMFGIDIYNKLVKNYTYKQWGRECKDLPSFIIKRLPLRFEYNNDYFDDTYQGIPIGGYTILIEKLLEGIEVILNYDYLKHRQDIEYDHLIYTGPIDAYFDYSLGHLEYRSIEFKHELIDKKYYQSNSVINYTDIDVPYTRIIEHKYFENINCNKTIITKEYPKELSNNDEPYYPINDERNNNLYLQYKKLAEKLDNVTFAGRLAEYKYMNMDEVIKEVIDE